MGTAAANLPGKLGEGPAGGRGCLVPRGKRGPVFVMSMIGLVGGLGMIAWSVAEPQPVRYIVGVVLVAVSVALLLSRWQRRRAVRAESGTGWRFRLRAAGVSTAAAVLLAAAGIAVPYLDQRSETEEGVIWRADPVSGRLIVVDGTVLRVDRMEGQVSGAVDLDDGSLGWSVPDGRWLTIEGEAIAAGADGLRYYSSAGEQRWEFAVEGGGEQVDAVHAATEGHVVFAECDASDDGTCHFVGIDPTGAQAWERDIEISEAFLSDQRSWRGETLPEVAVVAQRETEQAVMIDPVSGADLGTFARTGAARHATYGEVLVAASERGTDCQLDGYRIDDGEHLWTIDEVCGEGEYVYPLPASWAGTGSVMYAVVEEDVQWQALLAISLADGVVEELPEHSLGSMSSHSLNLRNFSAGDLVFRWSTRDVTAAQAPTLEQRWQVEVPGLRVRTVVGDSGTVAIVSDAAHPEHNPLVPPLPDASERHSFEYPTYVTLVDAVSGEVISATLVPEGVHNVLTLPGHRALLQTFEGIMLVGAP